MIISGGYKALLHQALTVKHFRDVMKEVLYLLE
ncbi:MAG: hypothetical protein Ct9H300mP21_05580 [Pseudomonadota bacterium]|nr:MAG: hypothetical protein Ct9H300mP21_05580 [Pseudomonadota bacterium]